MFVCLCVCVFVCRHDNSRTEEATNVKLHQVIQERDGECRLDFGQNRSKVKVTVRSNMRFLMVWYRIIGETSGLHRYLLKRQLLLDKVRGQVDDFVSTSL